MLTGPWNTGPIIALGAIALANVLIWLLGGAWTPQKRALVGIASVLVVFGVGWWASPDAFPETRQGIVSLVVTALVLVLAAAGAPVYKESFFTGKQQEPETIDITTNDGIVKTVHVVPAPENSSKTWGVWSRK